MAQLISVRTNAKFSINYETHLLEPEIELIFIISKPEYSVNQKKGEIQKQVGVSEIRIDADPRTITKLIGELQAIQSPVNSIESMSEAFNAIIKNSSIKNEQVTPTK